MISVMLRCPLIHVFAISLSCNCDQAYSWELDYKYDSVCRYCDIQLREHIVAKKQKEGKDTRERIMTVIQIIQPASTNNIQRHVNSQNNKFNKEIKRKAQKMYENENISDEDRRSYILRERRNGPGLRQVQRVVKELTNEGLLQKKNKLYSISEMARSEIKYYPRRFGSYILSQLMRNHFPTVFPLKMNLEYLIQIFGL